MDRKQSREKKSEGRRSSILKRQDTCVISEGSDGSSEGPRTPRRVSFASTTHVRTFSPIRWHSHTSDESSSSSSSLSDQASVSGPDEVFERQTEYVSEDDEVQFKVSPGRNTSISNESQICMDETRVVMQGQSVVLHEFKGEPTFVQNTTIHFNPDETMADMDLTSVSFAGEPEKISELMIDTYTKPTLNRIPSFSEQDSPESGEGQDFVSQALAAHQQQPVERKSKLTAFDDILKTIIKPSSSLFASESLIGSSSLHDIENDTDMEMTGDILFNRSALADIPINKNLTAIQELSVLSSMMDITHDSVFKDGHQSMATTKKDIVQDQFHSLLKTDPKVAQDKENVTFENSEESTSNQRTEDLEFTAVTTKTIYLNEQFAPDTSRSTHASSFPKYRGSSSTDDLELTSAATKTIDVNPVPSVRLDNTKHLQVSMELTESTNSNDTDMEMTGDILFNRSALADIPINKNLTAIQELSVLSSMMDITHDSVFKDGHQSMATTKKDIVQDQFHSLLKTDPKVAQDKENVIFENSEESTSNQRTEDLEFTAVTTKTIYLNEQFAPDTSRSTHASSFPKCRGSSSTDDLEFTSATTKTIDVNPVPSVRLDNTKHLQVSMELTESTNSKLEKTDYAEMLVIPSSPDLNGMQKECAVNNEISFASSEREKRCSAVSFTLPSQSEKDKSHIKDKEHIISVDSEISFQPRRTSLQQKGTLSISFKADTVCNKSLHDDAEKETPKESSIVDANNCLSTRSSNVSRQSADLNSTKSSQNSEDFVKSRKDNSEQSTSKCLSSTSNAEEATSRIMFENSELNESKCHISTRQIEDVSDETKRIVPESSEQNLRGCQKDAGETEIVSDSKRIVYENCKQKHSDYHNDTMLKVDVSSKGLEEDSLVSTPPRSNAVTAQAPCSSSSIMTESDSSPSNCSLLHGTKRGSPSDWDVSSHREKWRKTSRDSVDTKIVGEMLDLLSKHVSAAKKQDEQQELAETSNIAADVPAVEKENHNKSLPVQESQKESVNVAKGAGTKSASKLFDPFMALSKRKSCNFDLVLGKGEKQHGSTRKISFGLQQGSAESNVGQMEKGTKENESQVSQQSQESPKAVVDSNLLLREPLPFDVDDNVTVEFSEILDIDDQEAPDFILDSHSDMDLEMLERGIDSIMHRPLNTSTLPSVDEAFEAFTKALDVGDKDAFSGLLVHEEDELENTDTHELLSQLYILPRKPVIMQHIKDLEKEIERERCLLDQKIQEAMKNGSQTLLQNCELNQDEKLQGVAVAEACRVSAKAKLTQYQANYFLDCTAAVESPKQKLVAEVEKMISKRSKVLKCIEDLDKSIADLDVNDESKGSVKKDEEELQKLERESQQIQKDCADLDEQVACLLKKIKESKSCCPKEEACLIQMKNQVTWLNSLSEWTLRKMEDRHLQLGFLYNTIVLDVHYDENGDDEELTIINACCRSRLADGSKPWAKLVHNVALSQLNREELAKYFKGSLSQALFDISEIICSCRHFGEQLKKLHLKHTLKISDYSVTLVLIEKSTRQKVQLSTVVPPKACLLSSLSWNVSVMVGDIKSSDVESLLADVPTGPDYILRAVSAVEQAMKKT